MKVKNKSCKVIGIGGEPLLPGHTMELPERLENHPSIADYLKKGIIMDVDKASTVESASDISDAERARIAEEAIANYKKEQEELAAAQAEKQAAAREVKNMKKDELLRKAAVMGLDVRDDDTVDTLKEKILAVLNQ